MSFSDEKLAGMTYLWFPIFVIVLLLNGEILEGNKWIKYLKKNSSNNGTLYFIIGAASTSNPSRPTTTTSQNALGPPAGTEIVVMPSGQTYPLTPAVASSLTPSTPSACPAGIGVGYPRPHPGDGSIDFSKTEMVTPETSLNMSNSAFLASLGLEQLR